MNSELEKKIGKYEISQVIDNTALIYINNREKSGLINIKTYEVIGENDKYYTIYDNRNHFFFQTKEIEARQVNDNYCNRDAIRIYDTLNEIMVVEDSEVAKIFYSDYNLIVLKSALGKLHIFDLKLYRKSVNILDESYDNVELLFEEYGERYLSVTLNDKKGLYVQGKGFITPITFDNIEYLIGSYPHYYLVFTLNGKKALYKQNHGLVTIFEYDDIKKENNIIIFTKGNKYQFAFLNNPNDKSIEFDKMEFDREPLSHNLVYCYANSFCYVYDLEMNKLLLKIKSDEVAFLKKFDGYYERDYYYMFKFKKHNKYGIVHIEHHHQNCMMRTRTALKNEYDNINYNQYANAYFLEKDGKFGLFIGNRIYNTLIEPKYDKIDYFGECYYAFYTGNKCVISKATNPLEPVLEDIKVIESYNAYTLNIIYQKNGLLGIISVEREDKKLNIIQSEYTNIRFLGGDFFEVEKDGKKGIVQHGKLKVPAMYDYVEIHGDDRNIHSSDTIYFSLQLGDNCELAKCCYFHSFEVDIDYIDKYQEIKFLYDIFTVKDNDNLYIYNYKQELLKTFPRDTSFVVYEKIYSYGYRDYLYSFNDKFYYLKARKLVEYALKSLEYDYGTIIIKKDSKEACDKVYQEITAIDSTDINNTLLDFYEKTLRLQRNYPNIKGKR